MIDGPSPLRVLLVEDSADDAEIVLRALRDGGLSIESRVVATEGELRPSLTPPPDVIITDWTLPGFSGAAALAIAHESAASVPCILISGTLGEDLVVAALQNGAAAYVPKNRLQVLVPAVRQALAGAEARRERERLGSGRGAVVRRNRDHRPRLPDRLCERGLRNQRGPGPVRAAGAGGRRGGGRWPG
jgi:DNA-binding NtrC family response regulator